MSSAFPARAASAALALCCLLPLSATAQTMSDSSFVPVVAATGLLLPTSMVFLGPDDFLYTRKEDGRVRHVVQGQDLGVDVLDLAVNSYSERGLDQIILHPQFAQNRFVYVYYTASSTGEDTAAPDSVAGNHLVRYVWNGSTLTSPFPILDLPAGPLVGFHNGGAMAFGPEGELYVTIGDLDRIGLTQNDETTAGRADSTGCVMRVTYAGGIPADNPFLATQGMATAFAYGIRNSFGLAFDPVTGILWDTENGPDHYDEVNRVPPGTNSGWRDTMGPASRGFPFLEPVYWNIPGSTYRDPEFSWYNTVAPTAITFLTTDFYGTDLRNAIVVGDYDYGNISLFRLNAARDSLVLTEPGLEDRVADTDDERDSVVWGSGFVGITDLEIDPLGRLWVLSLPTGIAYRIELAPPPVAVAQRATTLALHVQRSAAHGDVRIGLEGDGPASVRVADASGRVRASWSDLAPHSTVVWRAQDAASGIYFITARSGAEAVTRRVVRL